VKAETTSSDEFPPLLVPVQVLSCQKTCVLVDFVPKKNFGIVPCRILQG
jgi:hypothetical protein